MEPSSLDRAAERLAAARRVLAITGAGISAESGIPTFRGAAGLWKNYDPMQLASPEGFEQDPALVWEWYAWRLDKVRAAAPNPGHRALARLEEHLGDGLLVLTQNVDGLHQAAGSRNVWEIHGNIRRVRCTVTDKVYAPDEIPIEAPFPVRTPEGHLARPDVVWFGEIIRLEAVEAVDRFLAGGTPDVCLLVGTTGMFPYIQRWAMRCAQSATTMIEINPEPSLLAQLCDHVFETNAGQCLPRLVGET